MMVVPFRTLEALELASQRGKTSIGGSMQRTI